MRICHKKDINKRKVKISPVTARGGLYGCEMLRIAHCLDKQLTDGGEVVAIMCRQLSTPQKHIFLLLVLISVRG
jgi:hypothetical protein